MHHSCCNDAPLPYGSGGIIAALVVHIRGTPPCKCATYKASSSLIHDITGILRSDWIIDNELKMCQPITEQHCEFKMRLSNLRKEQWRRILSVDSGLFLSILRHFCMDLSQIKNRG
jgi:hypothetical protein